MSALIAPNSWPAPAAARGGVARAFEPFAAEPLDDAGPRWLMKRNCSLSPAQLLQVYVALCVVTLLIAAGFWALGAPAMLPFAGGELLLIGAALVVHARHVGDHEALWLADGRLEVEQCLGSRARRASFRADRTRVDLPHGDSAMVMLSADDQRVQVGRYLRAEQRASLARELRCALHRQREALANRNMFLEPQR